MPSASRADGPLAALVDRPRRKAAIAATALVILVAGAVLRPRAAPDEPAVEAIAPILEEQVERREPARILRRLPETGRSVLGYAMAFRRVAPRAERRTEADFAVHVAHSLEPLGFGLAVSPDGEILTDRSVLDHLGRGEARIDGEPVAVTMVAYDFETGSALVRAAGRSLPVPPVAERSPEPGELVLAAAAVGGGSARLMPRFLECADCGGYVVGGEPLRPGTPVFNLDGEAFGIAGGPGRPVTAIGPALARLRRLALAGRGLPSTLGTVLQPPDEPLLARLGPGLIVAGVEPDGPAEQSGLRPGDILVALEGTALVGLQEAQERIVALPAGRRVEIGYRRAGQSRTAVVEPRATTVDPFAAGAPLPTSDAPLAASLFASAALAEAGVAPGARVLAVEGRPVTGIHLPRDLRRRGPPWLVRLHDGRRPFFAVVDAR